jgi:vesicle transport through interaction with t-SNAREs protein 1
MADLLDSDAGSELFSSYSAELNLVQADLSQKLEQIPDLTGEPRKAGIAQASRALEEAKEILDQMRIEKQNIPANQKSKVNTRFRNYQSDVDALGRKLASLQSDRAALFGSRYTDEEEPMDPHVEQRQQLLKGTERLERSSGRLRDTQRMAMETEEIGRNALADLASQRETIVRTRDTLGESEGYTDRSIKTLRGMARR